MSVTEFKAHCLELINEVSRTGETVVLTRRGVPTAMVVSPPLPQGNRWVAGRYDDKIKIVGDIISPLDEPWEALS